MSAAGSYAPPNVDDRSAPETRDRRRRPEPPDDSGDRPGPGDEAAGNSEPDETSGVVNRVDLAGLSVAGITRRRVGWVSAALVAVWIVVVFARQVGDAQAASVRAAQLADDNTALAAEVDALQNELALIVRPEYVAQQARAYRFGGSREIPFTLAAEVPDPVDGAPGSASVRLGAENTHQTPLESWLSLLFGPGG